jgi:hypothetical protein
MLQLICGRAKTLVLNSLATLAVRFDVKNKLASDGETVVCRNSCNEPNTSQKLGVESSA